MWAIHKVESTKSLFREIAEKAGFGVHVTPFWKGFGSLLDHSGVLSTLDRGFWIQPPSPP